MARGRNQEQVTEVEQREEIPADKKIHSTENF